MDTTASGPRVEPRPYQQRIINQAVDLFMGRAKDRDRRPAPAAGSLLIESPTGSGKTVMGLGIARRLQHEAGYSIGWCAMRRNLLAQAQSENLSKQFGLELRLISMFDKHPPQVDLLIVDEAQHDAALSMANLHSHIKPTKILGLSATPFRTDRFKLCFEKILKDAGIRALIQDGYLSPYHHYTIPAYTPTDVADVYARERDRWGQSLIFFHTMADCRACVAHLAKHGIEAELVTASSNRERQIARFSTGEISVLVNMLILSEGFDCPSLKTVFCRPSGKICTIQMCGRVFRKHPDHPFKQIVQCEQTRYPFIRSAAPLAQYLWREGAWRSVGSNDRIDAMVGRMQSLIASSHAQLPAMLSSPLLTRATGPRWTRRRRGQEASNGT